MPVNPVTPPDLLRLLHPVGLPAIEAPRNRQGSVDIGGRAQDLVAGHQEIVDPVTELINFLVGKRQPDRMVTRQSGDELFHVVDEGIVRASFSPSNR